MEISKNIIGVIIIGAMIVILTGIMNFNNENLKYESGVSTFNSMSESVEKLCNNKVPLTSKNQKFKNIDISALIYIKSNSLCFSSNNKLVMCENIGCEFNSDKTVLNFSNINDSIICLYSKEENTLDIICQ